MCGIWLAAQRQANDTRGIADTTNKTLTPSPATQTLLDRRGPDYQAQMETTFSESGSVNVVSLYSTVLHVRGSRICEQPLYKENKYFLQWNGEIYNTPEILSLASPSEHGIKDINRLVHEQSDTKILFDALTGSHGDVKQVLSQISGEFAFTFVDKDKGMIWWARDWLGRRSLLFSLDCARGDLRICSVYQGPEGEEDGGEMKECDAGVLYCLHLNASPSTSALGANEGTDAIGVAGGWILSKYLWSNLENDVSGPDTVAANNFYRPQSMPAINHLESPQCTQFNTLPIANTQECLHQIYREMVIDSHAYTTATADDHSSPGPVRMRTVSILFSGGIDSVCMAIGVARVLLETFPGEDGSINCVELLNVAFENERFIANINDEDHGDLKSSKDYYERVPDRITGRKATAKLQQAFPRIKWSFLPINVTRKEYENKKEHVIALMRPSGTVMDLSIAIALWFAASCGASGGAIITNSTDDHGNTSSIDNMNTGRGAGVGGGGNVNKRRKVVFVGIGADEQLGGYGRHRTAYEHGGIRALCAEMHKELARISTRNLGRDDRIVSDASVEARFPFLHRRAIEHFADLPINAKVDFQLPRGQAEKRCLRRIAWEWGMGAEVSFLAKRAIQFGAKTAKMHSKHERGQDAL